MNGCSCSQSLSSIMINLHSLPSHSGLSPANSAIFCKRAKVVATRTVFLVGFVKVDHYVCLHCSAIPRNSLRSVKAKFPWVLPLRRCFSLSHMGFPNLR
ncbi:hypothetical protein Y032_0039g56 [Ancylostoma ceylanicum]|uniref:Uncharacterized protein n=1 Tax=Ancylostoma ceylanicum TaxID=53326 RepID=A0A016UJ44_9BILA|nr:hypothetical protein Y032_0039g56 [Ancylostoma ceylanicum]